MAKDSVAVPWGMHKAIIGTSLGLGVVGIGGAFMAHADVGIIIGAWGSLFIVLAGMTGRTMDRAMAVGIATAIFASIGGMVGGVKFANCYFAYTGIGTIAAVMINAGANAAVTYVVGRQVAKAFLILDVGASVEAMIREVLKSFGIFGWKSI